MNLSSFEADNTLNRLFTHDWVAKAISNMGKLLSLRCFYFKFVSAIMIVVSSCTTLVKAFLVANFLCLREPCTSGFSPAMIVLEKAIV